MNPKIVILIWLLFALRCGMVDQDFVGFWAIDKMVINGEKVEWTLYSNGFSLKNDNTCTLPIGNWDQRHTDHENGTWQVIKGNNEIFLEISSINEVFGRTFSVVEMHQERDSISLGILQKMILQFDGIQFYCTKANY